MQGHLFPVSPWALDIFGILLKALRPPKSKPHQNTQHETSLIQFQEVLEFLRPTLGPPTG